MWKQVRPFNVNTSARLGWCLDYVQRGYGIGGGASTGGKSAWDSWTRITKKKHHDWVFPKNVIIPIWFDGWWEGGRYGHVAALNTATDEVYSSPWQTSSARAQRHDVLRSIAEVEQRYGMKYVGWSEDIAGQDVIIREEEEMVQNTDADYAWYKRFAFQMRGRDAWGADFTRAEFEKYLVGKTDRNAIITLSTGDEAEQAHLWQLVGYQAVKGNWQGQIHTLQAQVKELSTRPTKAQLDAANKKADDLAKSVDAAVEATKQALAKTAEADAKLKANEEATAQAKKEADNFLTAVINAVRGMFK